MPPPPPRDTLHGNGNYNQNLTTAGAITTLFVSIALFVVIQSVFEYTRFYKQIHLKRLQKKFQVIGRVPPMPPNVVFGWLFAIMKVSELDVLRMVGLDAYMLLRYQTVCFKLSVFMSFWGLLVLTPLYSTASIAVEWDKYTLKNVIDSESGARYRLWAAAIFGYLFAAYFCQLLYAEYNMFSSNRLKYLVQADPDSPQGDPDTPPQKYFTVMVERIPGHLRSAVALHKFFENLFPGEVYFVEIALDLTELNKLDAERKAIRDRLEQSIAFYEASNCRPQVYIQTGNLSLFPDDTTGMPAESENTLEAFFQKLIAPELYGFENMDALTYYTDRLLELNAKVEELQKQNYEIARNADKELERKIRNRHDTRAAAVLQSVAATTSKGISMFKGVDSLESLLFGPDTVDFKATSDTELLKVEVLATEDSPIKALEHFHATHDSRSGHIEDSHGSGHDRRGSVDSKRSGSITSQEGRDHLHGAASHELGIEEYDRSQFSSFVSAEDYLRRDSHPFMSVRQSGKPTHLHGIFQAVDDEGVHTPDTSVFNPLVSAEEQTNPPPVSQLEVADATHIGHSGRNSFSVATRSSSIKPFSAKEHSEVVTETENPLAADHLTEASINLTKSATVSEGVVITAAGGGERRRLPKSASFVGDVFNPLFDFAGSADGGTVPTDGANGDPKIYSFMTPEQVQQANAIAKLGAEKARVLTKEGWEQTKNATEATWRGMLEVERAAELVFLGAFNKYSTTAFVTFNSRVTESIANQMLLSHESMEISHAPNPHDIIWENVAIPKSQIVMRSFIINVGLSVGSLFWSSLVNVINSFGKMMRLTEFQQQYMSVVVMLGFLFSLPVLFDALARNYEGMKLESEIQNSIMTRYFYYQLVNIYVTVGLGTEDIFTQIYNILRHPRLLVDILAKTVPSVSLYFLSLVIVKIFAAVPMEMVRPWQLSTIMTMQNLMDKRKCTRRDLRTGAFYAWPMLYGWVYPQLMLVLIIQVTYACIAPLLMPLCAVFFIFAYLMYKYQLLYVYINDYQSGGYMWYAVFTRSLIALLFASLTLLGYLSLELSTTYFAGPFYFLLPLPVCIVYFWTFTEAKFKNQSMNLPLEFAKELDIRNRERKAAGKPVPHDVFTTQCYRQPALTEKAVYPEPFRDSVMEYVVEDHEDDQPVERHGRARRASLSLNVQELVDDGESDPQVLKKYFDEVVLPLAHPDKYPHVDRYA